MERTKKWKNKVLIINEDPDWMFPCRSNFSTESREAAEESFRKYFSKYCNRAISDAVIGIYEQSSNVPNNYITWIGEKSQWTHENGHPVDYSKEDDKLSLEPIWKVYHEFNIDPVQIFIDTVRDGGIRPWIALRMNDAHYNDEEPAYIHPTLFYEAKKNGWMISSGGEDYGYFNHCLDFARPEIRQIMLNYIREMINRYDADGLELDFMREIFCFDYKNNRDCHKIMTDFIREVRKITDEAAEAKGHDVLLMIRLHRSIAENLTLGFDVKALAEEGLVDAVNPTPRWAFSDSGIPVAEWKALLGENIAVFPGIETLQPKFTHVTYENAKAYAAGWFADGADGLYANNMMCACERDIAVWNLTPEKCLVGRRDFLVTAQDIETGFNPVYRPLPMNIDVDKTLPLIVGPIAASDELSLIIDFEGEKIPEVTVNNVAAESVSKIPPVVFDGSSVEVDEKVITEYQAVEYKFTGVETKKDIEVTFSGNGAVHYVNLIIQA